MVEGFPQGMNFIMKRYLREGLSPYCETVMWIFMNDMLTLKGMRERKRVLGHSLIFSIMFFY